MRTKPLVGERLWFGPRRLGWGWTPISWEGWAVVLVAVALFLMTAVLYDGTGGVVAQLIITGALVTVSFLKGTPPGGFGATRQLRQALDEQADSQPGWTIEPGPRKIL